MKNNAAGHRKTTRGAQPPAHVPRTQAMRLTHVCPRLFSHTRSWAVCSSHRSSRCCTVQAPPLTVQPPPLAQAAAARSSRSRSLKPPLPLAQATATRSSRCHSLKPPPLAQAAATRSMKATATRSSSCRSLKLLPLARTAAARSSCRRSLKPLAQATAARSRVISCDLVIYLA